MSEDRAVKKSKSCHVGSTKRRPEEETADGASDDRFELFVSPCNTESLEMSAKVVSDKICHTFAITTPPMLCPMNIRGRVDSVIPCKMLGKTLREVAQLDLPSSSLGDRPVAMRRYFSSLP